MNRQERRASRKRMRVIRGGRAEDPPAPDLQTPAGALGKALDAFLKQRMLTDKRLTPEITTAVVMNLAAAVAVATGVPREDYVRASEVLYDAEVAVKRV